MRVRASLYEQGQVLEDGTAFLVTAKRQRGWWVGEVYARTGSQFLGGYPIDNGQMANPLDGDEACALAWQQYLLAVVSEVAPSAVPPAVAAADGAPVAQ